MNELTLHPNVYSTGQSKGLISILERIWVREQIKGDGKLIIISGFANYNGGVRFYDVFKEHINNGGEVISIFSGSTGARLASKQVVKAMLDCGSQVHVVNRKRLLHAKCYGSKNSQGEMVVVTSGNFTGPGMSQNVEMSLLLDRPSTSAMCFSWDALLNKMLHQKWDFYLPNLSELNSPAWQLLYDEQASDIRLDESQEMTMVLKLSHADTARINATPGSDAGKGTQYFWLSKDCYDFFPPLTIRNERGFKATYSCIINLDYIELGEIDNNCRVTFEAENNLDFRLGTGKLRYTRLAEEGDLAVISRVGESDYQLRLIRQNNPLYPLLAPHAINFIGHQGKKYGFLSNRDFEKVSNIEL